MTTEELHFEFKRRWDKNSNNNRRGLTDLEVDQLFNNVSSDYVDLFATGKNPKNYTVGFEVTGQMIDMVSSLVRSYPEQVELPATSLDGDVYVVDFASLSEPYRHFKTAIIRDRYCGLVEVNIEQHQDLASVRLDFHRKASKKWKRCPAAIRGRTAAAAVRSARIPAGVEESPDSMRQGCRVTPGGGNPRDSATEKRQPPFRRG